MPDRRTPVLVLLVCALLASGCQASQIGSGDSPTIDERAASGTGDTAAVERPTPGTCRQVPHQVAFDQDYWFDDSPIVACSTGHTTETVALLEVDSPTIEAIGAPDVVDTYLAWCSNKARKYVAADLNHWLPYVPVAYLPSKQQISDGASWLRCDVAFAADYPYPSTRPATVEITALNAVIDHSDAVWPCLDADPRLKETQVFVPCDRPHRYEATGRKALIEDLDGKPSPDLLRAEEAQCHNDLTATEKSRGLDILTAWEPATADTKFLQGTCWLYRVDGARLPVRQ